MMTITKQDVLKELEKRKQEINTIIQREEKNQVSIIDNDEIPYDRTADELYKEPLSIEKTTTIKILLSWGGGEDGYKLVFNDEYELMRGVYYMADWGEYEEIDLNEDELNLIYNFYLYGEYPENLK